MKLLKQRFEEIMNFWVPVVFGTFKLLVLGTGMFLAIKSHYDGEKKGEEGEREGRGDESPVRRQSDSFSRPDLELAVGTPLDFLRRLLAAKYLGNNPAVLS